MGLNVIRAVCLSLMAGNVLAIVAGTAESASATTQGTASGSSQVLNTGGWTGNIVWSADGKTLFCSVSTILVEQPIGYQCGAIAIRRYQAASGALMPALEPLPTMNPATAFSSDLRLVAGSFVTRTYACQVSAWDLATGKEAMTLPATPEDTFALEFSPDNKLLFTGQANGDAFLWDVASAKKQKTLVGHTGPVSRALFRGDGKTLVTTSNDDRVRVWDTETGDIKQTFASSGPGDGIALSPDGTLLATVYNRKQEASPGGQIRLWNLQTGKRLHILQEPGAPVTALAFSRDGKVLASGSQKGDVRLWNAQTGAFLRLLKGHTKLVSALAFSPNDETLASAGNDRTMRLWSVR